MKKKANALCILALVEHMDSNGDGFSSRGEVESFGLEWKGDVEDFDLNGKRSFVIMKILEWAYMRTNEKDLASRNNVRKLWNSISQSDSFF